MKGRTIKNKQQVFFTRHAESYGNIGQPMIDSPLTAEGISQAKQLTGHFNLIIVSPLRRAKETLHHSQITYDHVMINNNFRERILSLTDQLVLDTKVSETDHEFWYRVNLFHQELETLCFPKILLIGHGYFFNGWYRNGCFPNPTHAEIIELID